MSHHRAPRPRRTVASALLAAVSIGATACAFLLAASPGASATDSSSSVSRTKTVTRTHLIDGANDVVDSRTVTVTADTTTNLRDRQGVNITWKGAHPTGGVIYNNVSQYAAQQEYPVVILQCRGVGPDSAPARQQVSPESCFTQTPDQRYQAPFRGAFPAYRLDRFAPAADRKKVVGAPNPIPDKCAVGPGAQRWVPFQSVDGTKYFGGSFGCAGLAPEQSIVGSSLSPSNATFGTTATDGTGTARMIVQDDQDNASLGCSYAVACSLVVIPIMGVSCDAAAAGLPAEDRPTDPTAAQKECTKTGFYAPGQASSNQGAFDPNVQTTVSGLLWWTASNWRNRMVIPISFAKSAASCGIVNSNTPANIYGSEYMLQATQQWAPTFCEDSKLFPLQHTQTSEVQAKNLLANGVTAGQYLGVKAAFQAAPPQPAFTNPIVQAPTAISGFAIGYVMDDGKHKEYKQLKLDARLLAKLLTMSYPAYPAVRNDWANNPTWAKYKPAGNNPLDLAADPEFLALNPGMNQPYLNQLEASSTMFVMSSDSDVMTALTSYINADPDARAWLDGKADPWGMVVNPNYKGISLPVQSWPLLDTYYNALNNECIVDNHADVLPLIAAPVSDPSQITFNMQLGITNSQVNCVVTGSTDSAGNRRLTAVGAQQPGIRFLLGLVSLADARRYQINTAALESQKDSSAADKFTDDAGRSFVAPTTASLRAAAQLLQPDDSQQTWPVPYDRMRSDAAGKDAYPGTLLMSTDVPTAGLLPADAARYAKFLDYAAGPGQVPGSDNGELPDGYLPISAANGLGELATYTVDAAAAVRQQRGFVPKPSAPAPPPSDGGTTTAPSSGPTASTPPQSTANGDHNPTGGGGPGGSGGGAGGGTSDGGSGTGDSGTQPTDSAGGGGASASRSSSQSPKPTGSPSDSSSPTGSPVPASALTANTKPGWTALAVPALAIIALASGALAAFTGGAWWRR